MARISKFDLDAIPSSSRLYIATWDCSKNISDHLERFVIQWQYYTFTSDVKYNSQGKVSKEYVWIDNGRTDIKIKQSTYTAPEIASKIRVRVKPVSKKDKPAGKDKKGKQKYDYWWTGEWTDWKEKNVTPNDLVPAIPNVPSLTADGTNIKFKIEGIDSAVDQIIFEYTDVYNKVKTTGSQAVKESYNSASWTLKGAAGHVYRARAKSRNVVNKTINGKSVQYQYDSEFSAWSNECSTIPETPNGLVVVANSASSVSARWNSTSGAKSYIIGYARNRNDLISMSGSYNSAQTSENITTMSITGIEAGYVYYFRVAAVNESNNRSEWSAIATAILGVKPNPPTIWSSTTVAKKGERINLYILHNSIDGSAMREYDIEIYQNGNHYTTIHGYNQNYDDYGQLIDKNNLYSLDTNGFNDSDVISWRAKTLGVHSEYSDWSAPKSFTVYEPPSISLGLYSGYDYSHPLTIIEHFPLHIYGHAEPFTQKLINYNITIISNEDYESGYNEYGETFNVNEGDEVFSKSYNANNGNIINETLTPGDIDLSNGVEYTIKCTAAFNSGLTADTSIIFHVSWEDEFFEVDGVIDYNQDDLSASIRPTCQFPSSDDSTEIKDFPDVTLAVYRRTANGKFVKIESGITNVYSHTTTDPHPSLDTARYRITATSNVTGAISYVDLPSYPISETSIIIQWNEQWRSYNTEFEGVIPAGNKSVLKLPYNIDVSESNSKDVNFINYIGRERPVGYYGTQLGETSTWSCEIPKSDVETIYQLRRLAVYMGNVYVREPSGLGYWAEVDVSFSQTHCEMTIPVTLKVTPVEGGI